VNQVALDVIVVLVILLVGGFFSGAEMALVSLREGQVRSLAQRGKRGQRAAKLAQDPNRFLSAVQIGVTVATLLSGAFGAATLAAAMKDALIADKVSSGWASVLSLITVTVAISFFSLVLQELAPKRLALQRPESLALIAAPLLDRISVLARPLVWLLSMSTNVVVRLLGGDPSAGRNVMTAEELQDLVAGHQALSEDERRIVADVFDAGKRQLREVLLPRTEVEFIAADTPLARAAETAAKAPHSRFPVYQESYDDVIGFVHLRDLLDPGLAGKELVVGEVCRPVERLPISKRVLPALSEMRRDGAHLAIVVDEYGGTAGIVTLEDLVEELVGDIRDEYDVEESPRQLVGGQVEVDGLLNLDEFAEQTGVALPEGPYETVAGYVLAMLGQLPVVGDAVEVDGHQLTVTEMDGRRIARVRVGPPDPVPGPGSGATETAEGPASQAQGLQASGGSRGSPPGAGTGGVQGGLPPGAGAGGVQGGLPPAAGTAGRATPPPHGHAS
jgi:putative hemolysin